MINIKNVTKVYDSSVDSVKVLNDVNISIKKGEFLSIIGTSGSGKTTLLNIIGGLDSQYDGKVTVLEQSLKDISDKKLSLYRNKNIGFIFQGFNILNHLSVFENIKLPQRFSDSKETPKEIKQRVNEILKTLSMEDKIDAYPSNLSGGQRQRVAIARALFNNPSILLCDEPTGNLDRETGLDILDIFRRLNKEKEITVIIITHEQHIAKLTDRMITIEKGKIVKDEILK